MNYSSSLIDIADPARAMASAGFQMPQVYSALLRIPRLRSKIEARLEEKIAPLSNLEEDLANKLSMLFDLVSNQFDDLLRGLIALGQARRIASSTDGSEMSALAEFYGDKAVFNFLLKHRTVTTTPLLILDQISIEQLEELRPIARALLLSCFEEHHIDKLYLMAVIADEDRERIDLETSDRDQILRSIQLINDELLNPSGASETMNSSGRINAED